MLCRLIIFVCLCFNFVANAYANDPFALLFGEDELDASSDRKTGEDDIILLRLLVRDYLLDEDWTAYYAPEGLCIPFQALSEALELPLEFNEEQVSGWILHQDREFNLAMDEQDTFIQSSVGWCATAGILEEYLPVQIKYRPSTLTLEIEPTDILPIEARLAREEARKSLTDNTASAIPEYRPVQNPYRWFSLPVLDVNIETQLDSDSGLTGTANLSGAADIMKMTGEFRVSSTQADMINSARFKLSRENELAAELGFLKARRFAMGDISSASQPLIGQSNAGRGFFISNRPVFRSDQFDSTDIRGILPIGWEAELYDGHVLLAFVTEPDRNGEYVFQDIPLRPGYNRLTVKLFGPHGETEERTISQFVGPELCPSGEWRYHVGVLDSSTALFGESLVQEIDTDKSEQAQTPEDARLLASTEYGLSSKYSLRGDVLISEDTSLGTLSLIGSGLGGYGAIRLASDGKGRPAMQTQFQKRISATTSLNLNAVDFGTLESDVSGYGQNRLQTILNGRLDTRFRVFGASVPSQTELSWARKDNGSSYSSISNRMSGQIKRTRWSHSMRYFSSSDTDGEFQGEFLASRMISGTRFRASANYAVQQSFRLNAATLSAQKKFSRDTFAQGNLNYDFATQQTSFDAALSHNLKPVALTLKSGLTSNGDWSIGAGLSMALYFDRPTQRLKLGKPGLSRTGVIAPRVFDDINDNGVFDQEDMKLSGVEFIAENALRSESTDADGIAIIADLSTSKNLNNEVKLSSISDPFLRPIEIGRSIKPRPGQIVSYDIPLTATGEIEGTLLVKSGDHDVPVAGITLQARNSSGQIIGQTTTEYDGYFYLEGVPAAKLTLTVAKEDLKAMKGKFMPEVVTLSRQEPSNIGLVLFVLS